MLLSHSETTGAGSGQAVGTRRYFCAGCQEWVASVEGHRSGKGSTPLCGRCSRPTVCDCCRREVPRGLCEADANDVVICVECGGDVPPGCTIPSVEAVCGGRDGWNSCIHRERPLCLIEAALAALPFLEAGISAPRWVVSELRRTADELVESARDRPGDGHGKCYDDPLDFGADIPMWTSEEVAS